MNISRSNDCTLSLYKVPTLTQAMMANVNNVGTTTIQRINQQSMYQLFRQMNLSQSLREKRLCLIGITKENYGLFKQSNSNVLQSFLNSIQHQIYQFCIFSTACSVWYLQQADIKIDTNGDDCHMHGDIYYIAAFAVTSETDANYICKQFFYCNSVRVFVKQSSKFTINRKQSSFIQVEGKYKKN